MSETPPPLPELAEPDVVRHFTNLSTRNFSVDTHFYPLGSCTMKYNPKRNERLAALPGMADLHPYQPESTLQGMLALLHQCQHNLGGDCRAAGRLAPAGRRGARRDDRPAGGRRLFPRPGRETARTVLIPDSAHGTNPASAAMAGFKVGPQSRAPPRASSISTIWPRKLNAETAVFMITNPNTLGLFEPRIERDREDGPRGGRTGLSRRGQHERHPGCRPAGRFRRRPDALQPAQDLQRPARRRRTGRRPDRRGRTLAPFLPAPIVVKDGDGYRLDYDRPKSIGRVRSFFGNVGVLVRMYCYIRTHGPEGLRRIAEDAVLNANYLLLAVKNVLPVPHGERCMHEFVASARGVEVGAGHLGDGHRQAAVGLRLSCPDGLFSADRPRGDDDRADRDREPRRRWTPLPKCWRGSWTSRRSCSTTPRTSCRFRVPTKSWRRGSRCCGGGTFFKCREIRYHEQIAGG